MTLTGISAYARGNHTPSGDDKSGSGNLRLRTEQPGALSSAASCLWESPPTHGATNWYSKSSAVIGGISAYARGNHRDGIVAVPLPRNLRLRTGQPQKVPPAATAVRESPPTHGATPYAVIVGAMSDGVR